MKNMINYSKLIYSEQCILTAINDYKRLAEIKLSVNDNYYICEFKNCKIDSERIICEFNNYLIELLNLHGAKK